VNGLKKEQTTVIAGTIMIQNPIHHVVVATDLISLIRSSTHGPIDLFNDKMVSGIIILVKFNVGCEESIDLEL